MKKFLLILTLVLSNVSLVFADGQSCTISGDNGSTIMIVSDNYDGTKITLNLENDSNNSSANVTVSIDVIYKNGSSEKTVTKKGYTRCQANSSATIEIPIEASIGVYNYSSYRINSISGAKCL